MNHDHKRIAAVQIEADGKVAAVWLGHDKISDVVTLYDACIFNAEVLPVIAEGLNARGRWIPIAWGTNAGEFIKKLQERGCNTLYEGVNETPELAEMTSRDIWERMRTGRFKVDKRLAEWTQEFNAITRQDGKIPVAAYPMMAATRYAIAQLSEAKRLAKPVKPTKLKPKIAMI